jgi:hypothetical protein
MQLFQLNYYFMESVKYFASGYFMSVGDSATNALYLFSLEMTGMILK